MNNFIQQLRMDRVIDVYNTFVMDFATDPRRRNTAKVSISAVVALVSMYLVYERVARPPRTIRHIPSTNFLAYIKGYLQGKSVDKITYDISIPALAQSNTGIYTRLDLFGWGVHVAGPEAAKKLLLKTDIFVKAHELNASRIDTLGGRFTGGDHIANVSGHRWKAQRMIMNPAFHRAMPVQLFGNLSAKVLDMMDKQIASNGGRAVNFHNFTQRFALDVIGLAGFGFEFHAIEDPENEWVNRYERFVKASRDPFFLVFPFFDHPPLMNLFPGRVRAHKDLTVLLDMIDTVIASKHQQIQDKQPINSQGQEKDLLTLMLEAGMEGEGILSDADLKSNLCIFFIAGHETTASALSCAAGFLAKYPELQDRTRKEVLKVLGDAPEHVLPTAEQTRNMTYMNMVLKETMRMNSPASAVFPRKATEDTELNGVFIPKGTNVSVQIHELHHNPAVWRDPETFNPDRFAPGGEADQLNNQGIAWTPFGNGSRQCIGMNFSLDEQRTLFSMLLRKYEFWLPEDSIHKDKIITEGVGLMQPKKMEIVFKRRY